MLTILSNPENAMAQTNSFPWRCAKKESHASKNLTIHNAPPLTQLIKGCYGKQYSKLKILV
jgi:hypothetical protein